MKKLIFLFIISLYLMAIENSINGQVLDTLLNFDENNGNYPTGSLILSRNSLYGITQVGGVLGYGNIFKINSDGTGFKTLLSFGGSIGFPVGSLTLSGNALYGFCQSGCGNIFRINTDGTNFGILIGFDDFNGCAPEGSLTVSGNTLYGLTNMGGAFSEGVIFKFNTNGSEIDTMMSFNGINGKSPTGSLILSENTLYGTTYLGGKFDAGVIFKINTDGTGFDTLLSFNGNNGNYPLGTLTLSGETLYGMTQNGGKNDEGVIFKINTDGNGFDTLMSFNGQNGKYPIGSLSQSGNTLYGITEAGGLNNNGVIFKINTDGTGFVKLMSFNDYGAGESLTLSGDTFFLQTQSGGTFNYGAILKKYSIKQLTDTVKVYNGVIKYGSITDGSTASEPAQFDSIPADSIVYIFANSPAKGYQFDKWIFLNSRDTSIIDTTENIILNNTDSSNTFFYMLWKNIILRPTYKYRYYDLIVNNGSGSGQYLANESIKISAYNIPFAKFYQWKWSNDTISIPISNYAQNIDSSETYFTQPYSNVDIEATYVDTVFGLVVNNGYIEGGMLDTSGQFSSIVLNNNINNDLKIWAFPPDSTMQFVKWTGDTSYINNVYNDTANISIDTSGYGLITINAAYEQLKTNCPETFTVIDRENGLPISKAQINIGEIPLFTDSTGTVSIVLSTGEYSIITNAFGYLETYDYIKILPGCLNKSITIYLEPACGCNLKEQNLNNLIFPNPATDKITINLQGVSDLQNTLVSIYDIRGKLMLQQALIQNQTDINIKQLEAGIYIVKISNDNTTVVRKMVVK